MMRSSTPIRRLCLGAALLAALWLAGCGTGGKVAGQLSDAAPTASGGRAGSSSAASARDYRRDAARHVYALNGSRIYRGQLPPLLYAIGTLQVSIDSAGQVRSLHWLRAPQHAPDAIAGIERTVLAAAPYPVSPRLGAVVWTDTWLWDESGRFQLDTLSEGQLQAAP
ncbi:hypothetical protein ACFPPF_13970 [Xenophilus aerolatus]|jgi:hypothetical protein|nr:hypothetical protein [Xenophilus aerolatus]